MLWLLALLPLNAAPSQRFDLSHWKLTLPIGQKGRPVEIGPRELSGGYRSAFFYSDPADGAMVFWCPANGVTTKGSPHPRSELREEIAGGDGNVDWTIGQFRRSELTASCRVTQVGPQRHRVIVGQIHGVDFPVIKLDYDYSPAKRTGRLVAQMNLNDPAHDRIAEHVLQENIPLGANFSYTIRTISAGETAALIAFANGAQAKENESAWIHARKNGYYFKAGCYCQEDGGQATEGCTVAFTAVAVKHER